MSQVRLISAIFMVFWTSAALAKTLSDSMLPMTWEKLSYNESTKSKLMEGGFFVESKVQSHEPKEQSLAFQIAGLHPKNCTYALRKLSQYERFKDELDFVKKSEYDEKKGRIRLLLSSSLLPYNMILDFKIPRIKSPGLYPFSFDDGFLSGLKGDIHVSEHQNRCLFYGTARWRGPDSGINSLVFEFFSSTLGRLAIENLFRFSRTL